MRTTLLSSIAVCSLLLAACNGPSASISQQNLNPLTASRYGDELADYMANFVIQQDPIVKQPGMNDLLNREIAAAKEIGQNAREKQSEGMMGALIGIKADVQGLGLYVDDTLYLSSDFLTSPGPSLHVYLTTVVDPRDVTFPDPTALDLGEIHAAYGAQQYEVPSQKNPELLRTLVLWDTKLKVLYSFAQLSKQK